MGSIMAQEESQMPSEMTVPCSLTVDDGGEYACLVPHEEFACTREDAIKFARWLVPQLAEDKRYNADVHELKHPSPPTGGPDFGLHCTIFNTKFHEGKLDAEQRKKIRTCGQTFKLRVVLTDVLVLPGMPSRDVATGVLGYVALPVIGESNAECARAWQVFRTDEPPQSFQKHVSICGWKKKGMDDFQEARGQLGLPMSDEDVKKTDTVFRFPVL